MTLAKKRRKEGHGLGRGAAIEKHAAIAVSLKVPSKSRLMYPDDTSVREVGVASFKRRTLCLAVADLPWLIQTICDDLRAVSVPDPIDAEVAAVAAGDQTALAVGSDQTRSHQELVAE